MPLHYFIAAVLFLSTGNTFHKQSSACPTLEPRLQVGNVGQVILGGIPNNVREQPSRSAERLTRIEPGNSFLVIEDFQCVEGYRWWHVRYNGIEGWTPEGDVDGTYWLEPLETDGELIDESSARTNNIQVLSLPSDLVVGLAAAPGGAPGVVTACYIRGETRELFALMEGTAGFDPIGFNYTNSSNTSLSSFSTTLDFEQMQVQTPGIWHDIYNAYRSPAICSAESVTSEDIEIIAPVDYTGEEALEPVIYEPTEWLTEIHLPVVAYTVPGIWEMRVNNASLSIEIVTPQQPSIIGYILLNTTTNLFSEGLPFALVDYAPNGTLAVINLDGEFMLVTTDATGNTVVNFPDLVGVLPRSNYGRNLGFFLFPAAETYHISSDIPEEEMLSILEEAIWSE